MIATECCFADVLFIHETKTKQECTEIEIKISKQDLLNDFAKPKHQFYSENKSYENIQPDYFYYCMPISLYEDNNLDDLELPNDNYGVITISPSGGVWVKKPAKRLTKKFNPENSKRLKMRMSSELTNFWTKKENIEEN
jgi:hypothetical protein